MTSPANPWNKNKRHNGPNLKKLPTSAETKFQEAHKKLQAAVQKHIKEYDSSSDEEDEIEPKSVISMQMILELVCGLMLFVFSCNFE